ncbi:5-oxoprolinase subunit PxpB [Aquimarina pacifica]|uniref:5-oxoprolinase subunit PxpB n=1 Tax=Aquimarina pacifica TaxID=1296415 RepID=UPI00046EF973|nr:5-oxoprolinase subunit PxpB [Aquimarina pacifica]
MSNKYNVTYKKYSERSILIQWPAEIDQEILEDLLFFKKKISEFYGNLVVEVISGYNSLLVCYSTMLDDFPEHFSILKSLYDSANTSVSRKKRLWKIPVCYSEVFATDIIEFSKNKSIHIDEVIALHTSAVYSVYFIGFLPGFLYLGGLHKKLHEPRKSTPSLNIKKGAVAIGGKQTGIYPIDSPGGWHVIGRCPVDLFDVSAALPSVFYAGDSIQFYAVSINEYTEIKEKASKGILELTPDFL